MSKNKLSFLKTNVIGLLAGFIFVMVVAVITSAVVGKVSRYERFYPLISSVLLCIPSFVGARFASARMKRMLIPIGLLQGTCTVLILFAVSAALNGSFSVADRFLMPSGLIFASSLTSVLLPSKKKKRH